MRSGAQALAHQALWPLDAVSIENHTDSAPAQPRRHAHGWVTWLIWLGLVLGLSPCPCTYFVRVCFSPQNLSGDPRGWSSQEPPTPPPGCAVPLPPSSRHAALSKGGPGYTAAKVQAGLQKMLPQESHGLSQQTCKPSCMVLGVRLGFRLAPPLASGGNSGSISFPEPQFSHP